MKKKTINEEENNVEKKNSLSKKEIYDLNKKKKEESKQKKKKTESKQKKNKQKKTYTHNLGARIFAIIMLVLMIGSIVATISMYIR